MRFRYLSIRSRSGPALSRPTVQIVTRTRRPFHTLAGLGAPQPRADPDAGALVSRNIVQRAELVVDGLCGGFEPAYVIVILWSSCVEIGPPAVAKHNVHDTVKITRACNCDRPAVANARRGQPLDLIRQYSFSVENDFFTEKRGRCN